MAAPASLSLFARWQQAWQQGLNFQGRARRADYWGFFLFQFLLSLGLSLVVLILGGSERAIERVGSLFSLVSFVPSLAVAVRRSHDLAWSGWYGLLGLPMLGSIVGGLVGLVAGVLLGGGGFFGAGGLGFGFVFGFWAGYFPVLFRAGQPQANRFGPPPR